MPDDKSIAPEIASIFASHQLAWKEILTCGKVRCSNGRGEPVDWDVKPEELNYLAANFKKAGGALHPLICDYRHAGVDGDGDRVSGYVYDLKVESVSRPGYT